MELAQRLEPHFFLFGQTSQNMRKFAHPLHIITSHTDHQGRNWPPNIATHGVHYGKGVEEDKEQAVHWLKLAAEQGNSLAQSLLGRAYYQGKGVQEDKEQAVHWWKLAAEQGLAEAQEILKEINSTQADIIPFPNSQLDKSIDEKKIDAAIQTLKMLAPELRPDLKKVYLTKIKDIPGISDHHQKIMV